MLNRNTTLAGFVVAAVAIAGACSDVPPTQPLAHDQDVSLFGGAPRNPAAFSGGLDAAFVRIAQENPGFGGFYYGDDGALNIVTTGVQTMSSRLGTSMARMGVDLSAQPVRSVTGQYDFVQLASIRSQVNSLFSIHGMVFTDADEKLNRVHVGVENERARADVERGLDMLGVPREAVVISITPPIVPLQGLRDRVRPVAGGLQINWPGIPGFVCTLGFNVRSPVAPGVHGFVTNSHCTNVRGEVTGTPYYQHRQDVADTFIGTEAHDLPFFSCADFNPEWPPEWRCRWSDAAGVRYAPGIDNAFGRIYRTTGINDGSLTIDPANPMFEIVAERLFPNVGDVIHKVGRTTGWTSGTVSQTCGHTSVSGTDPLVVMLCQDFVSGVNFSAGGDSGSPIFRRIGETEVELNGIHWGGGGGGTVGVFSAMGNIRFENPGPAPWITFPGQTPPGS